MSTQLHNSRQQVEDFTNSLKNRGHDLPTNTTIYEFFVAYEKQWKEDQKALAKAGKKNDIGFS